MFTIKFNRYYTQVLFSVSLFFLSYTSILPTSYQEVDKTVPPRGSEKAAETVKSLTKKYTKTIIGLLVAVVPVGAGLAWLLIRRYKGKNTVDGDKSSKNGSQTIDNKGGGSLKEEKKLVKSENPSNTEHENNDKSDSEFQEETQSTEAEIVPITNDQNSPSRNRVPNAIKDELYKIFFQKAVDPNIELNTALVEKKLSLIEKEYGQNGLKEILLERVPYREKPVSLLELPIFLYDLALFQLIYQSYKKVQQGPLNMHLNQTVFKELMKKIFEPTTKDDHSAFAILDILIKEEEQNLLHCLRYTRYKLLGTIQINREEVYLCSILAHAIRFFSEGLFNLLWDIPELDNQKKESYLLALVLAVYLNKQKIAQNNPTQEQAQKARKVVWSMVEKVVSV